MGAAISASLKVPDVAQSCRYLPRILNPDCFLTTRVASVRRKGKKLEMKPIPQSTDTSILVSYAKTSGSREAG